jgi:hypothetical protein
MRPSVLLIAALAIAIVAGGRSPASADVGVGVVVSLPPNSPLASVLRAEARNGDPDRPYEAVVHAYVNVGTERIADLGEASVPASVRSSVVSFAVPREARVKARREGARTGHRRATVTFVISARDPATGDVRPPFAAKSFVRLGPGSHPRGPTRLALAGEGVSGGGGTLVDGDVFIAAPHRWLRTSPPRASTATFGPVAVTADCRATIIAGVTAIAARTPLADPNAPPRLNPARASVVTAGTYRADPYTTAIGLQRYARHRYAGVRISVDFVPGCSPAAAHAHALLATLRQIVRSVHVHVRRTRRAPLPNS